MTKVVRKKIKLIPFQDEFVNDIGTPHLALVCGLGAGKTKAAVFKSLKLLQENPGCNGIGCEPTGPQLAIFTEEMNMTCRECNIKYKYVGQGAGHPAYYTFDFGSGPQKLLLVSALNYKASLVGFNAAFGFVDEMDTIPNKEDGIAIWNALNDRLRDPKANFIQSFVTSTPEGYHIISEIFADELSSDGYVVKAKPRHKVIQRSTFDNIHLKQSYIQGQLSRYSQNQAAAKIYGRFVNVFGFRVYDTFQRDRNSTTLTLTDFAPTAIIHCGMDFNVGQMSAVMSVIQDGKVYVIDEIVGPANTDAMIAELKKRYPNRAIYVYPDSSGKSRSASADGASISSITKLQEAGFQCFYKGNNPSIVKERIPAVNALFYNALGVVRCYVNVSKCPVLVKGLEQQGWKDGKPDKGVSVEINGRHIGLDHCLDGFGYFCHFRYPVQGIGKVTVH